MNKAIGNNIRKHLKKIGKSPSDLAGYLGTTRLSVGNMLDGSRTINAMELREIALFCKVSVADLVKPSRDGGGMNVMQSLIGKAGSDFSDSARKGLETADQIADMICFYAKANESAEEMLQPWEGWCGAGGQGNQV